MARDAAAAAEIEAERLALEEARRKAAEKEDTGGSGGGAFVAIVLILLLLVWGTIWIYFSDKLCCCLKDKIRDLKQKARAKFCKNEQQIMHGTYEFDQMSTPKSPSSLRSKKHGDDSSRSPLRERKSVRWHDEE